MTIRMQLRTPVAALMVALAIVASPALQGVALAADKQENNTPGVGTPATTERAARPGTTNPRPVVTRSTQAATVTAHPTGTGPADQKECDQWARDINFAIDASNQALAKGDDNAALGWAEVADDLDSVALGRGCFTIY